MCGDLKDATDVDGKLLYKWSLAVTPDDYIAPLRDKHYADATLVACISMSQFSMKRRDEFLREALLTQRFELLEYLLDDGSDAFVPLDHYDPWVAKTSNVFHELDCIDPRNTAAKGFLRLTKFGIDYMYSRMSDYDNLIHWSTRSAIEHNQYDVFLYLFGQYKNRDAELLCSAIEYNRLTIMRHILGRFSTITDDMMKLAVRHGSPLMVQELLARMTVTDPPGLMNWALRVPTSNVHMLKTLIKHGFELAVTEEGIFNAAVHDNVLMLKFLFGQCDPSKFDLSRALLDTVWRGHADSMLFLLPHTSIYGILHRLKAAKRHPDTFAIVYCEQMWDMLAAFTFHSAMRSHVIGDRNLTKVVFGWMSTIDDVVTIVDSVLSWA